MSYHVYDQVVDVIVQSIDTVLAFINLQIVPFIQYCYVEIEKNEIWRNFCRDVSEFTAEAVENNSPTVLIAATAAVLVVTILLVYRKTVFSFVYRRRVSGPQFKIEQYRSCESDLRKLIDDTNCNPIMLRLAVRSLALHYLPSSDSCGCLSFIYFLVV
jgi:hypothetical protein